MPRGILLEYCYLIFVSEYHTQILCFIYFYRLIETLYLFWSLLIDIVPIVNWEYYLLQTFTNPTQAFAIIKFYLLFHYAPIW